MNKVLVPQEIIESKIILIRGKKVILDRDLAMLYKVSTKVLNQAVKRNMDRFPEDFMFQLSKDEFENWRSQIVTSNSDRMGLRRRPYAFSEHGILMLSSVLSSKIAIQVNIQIMRVFVRLKEMIVAHKELSYRLSLIEKRMEKKDGEIQEIFQLIRELMVPPLEKPKGRIGFHAD